MQFLGRLLKDPNGFATDPAFQAGAAHSPVLRPARCTSTATARAASSAARSPRRRPEFTRAVLGVPAINYSTLLNRSVDYTEFAGRQPRRVPGPDRPAVRLLAHPDAVGPRRGRRLHAAPHRRSAPGHAEPPGAAHRGVRRSPGREHRHRDLRPVDRGEGLAARARCRPQPGRRPVLGHRPAFPRRPTAGRSSSCGTTAPHGRRSTNTPPEGPQYGADPHGFGHDNPGVAQEALDFLQPDGVFNDVCNGGPCQHTP